MKYVGLIGDVVESKKIPFQERINFQENLQKDLEYFNELYKNQIAAKLTITLGDEFQGLFLEATPIFELITYLSVKYPYKIRYGIGIGTLYTNIVEGQAIGSDGPVWWNARSSLQDLKKVTNKDNTVLIKGINDKSLEELLNISLTLSNFTSKWTKTQKNLIEFIIRNYRLTNNFKQIELAHKLDVPKSTISRLLNRSNYMIFAKLINVIIIIINKELLNND